jgi:hypothetical protein
MLALDSSPDGEGRAIMAEMDPMVVTAETTSIETKRTCVSSGDDTETAGTLVMGVAAGETCSSVDMMSNHR